MPAYLRLFGGRGIGQESRTNLFQWLSGVIFSIVIRFKKTTLLLLLMIAGYFMWGAKFLQVNKTEEDREDIGLHSAFQTVFPIVSYSGNAALE